MDKKQPQPQQRQQQIKIADNIPGAEYSNLANISHNKEEFQIVFANVMPPSGRVVGKIISTPGHFKRIIAAMKDNLKKYEEKFGEVKEAADLGEKEIGFKN
ncbi:DUF3467 domain-containing protein [Candidatus Parcubacteria bacterium]|nr:DUF3467 domain-containing protein [Candidatus Parcubacteria bacterium]